MILLFFFILLILLFILPFVPGTCEFVESADDEPLFINMVYSKEPGYFGSSFKKKMLDALGHYSSINGRRLFNLSRQEFVEIVDSASIPTGFIFEDIYYVKHNLRSGKQVIFEKEVYVRGNAYIGEGNLLRSLACDGDVHILSGVQFVRWLHAEGRIAVEEQSDLGMSAVCSKELSLAPRCSFKRLYGFPIVCVSISVSLAENKPSGEDTVIIGADAACLEVAVTSARKDDYEPRIARHAKRGKRIVLKGNAERNLSSIPAHSRKDCNIITIHSLTIGEHTLIRGHIKTHGNLIANQSVTITGNVFAEGDIYLGPHCRVMGTVFTQGRIVFGENVTVGSKGQIKSVISKKGITLHCGVKVYGYVSTEGEGRVV